MLGQKRTAKLESPKIVEYSDLSVSLSLLLAETYDLSSKRGAGAVLSEYQLQ